MFGTGRAVGELSTPGNVMPGARLALTGTLYEPAVSGVLNLRRTDIRLPTTTPALRTLPPPGLMNPQLDLKLNVGEQVRVRTALVAADIRTETGAPIDQRSSQPS